MFAKGAHNATRKWLIGSAIVFGPVFYKMTDRQANAERDAAMAVKKHSKPVVYVGGNNKSVLANSIVSTPVQETVKSDLIDKPFEMEKPFAQIPHVQYILVGTGTAAYSAMEAIRNADPSAQIVLIGEERDAPYVRPPLSKELWFTDATPEEKDAFMYKDWQGEKRSIFYLPSKAYNIVHPSELTPSSSAVQVIAGYHVDRLDVEKQFVILANGQKIHYDKVLIATGGTPNLPSFASNADEQVKSKVMTFRTLEDYKKLSEWTESNANENKTIAVVGGGFLGSELAVALGQKSQKNKFNIVQVFPEQGNMALAFPRYLTEWTTRQISKLDIQVKPQSNVQSLTLTNDEKVNLVLENGDSVQADLVVVAAGLKPNVDVAARSGLELDSERGGILANAELEARSNVFVAGDVSSYHDIALGRRRVEHHDHAIMSGKQAGENMVAQGSKKPYTHQSMFWSDLGPKISYEAVGLIDAKLSTVGIWAKQDEQQSKEFDKGVVLYVNNQKQVVGVLLWNVHGKLDVARKVLKEQSKFEDANKMASLFGVYA